MKRLLVTGIMFLALWGRQVYPLGHPPERPTDTQQSTQMQQGDDVAKAAASGVERVVDSFSGSGGALVVVLEERHNSRVAQLQEAITLTRLHEMFGLKNIALEGYLKNDTPLTTDWFVRAVVKKTPEARARVATQFLRQGEISAAEFLALVYPDVVLLATETASSYNAALPAGIPPLTYLGKIARVDPSWAKEKSRAYESEESIMSLTGEQHLELAKEIQQYAQEKSIVVTPNEQLAMKRFIDFWQKRMSSNKTIVGAAIDASNASPTVPVAANVGAFHTQGVSDLLKASRLSYVVLQPLYAPGNPSKGDLTDLMYDRKNRRQSIFAGGLSLVVVTEVSSHKAEAVTHKKPQPVASQAFFQAEAEIYGQVTSIAEAILSPTDPPGPPNGGRPPFGLSAEDYDGKWIRIVPASIQYLPGKGGARNAVLIPVTFKSNGNTIWVGAVWRQGKETGQETVEQILQHALQGVLDEKMTPERAEDSTGNIQMSDNAFAIIGRNPATVRRAIMSEV